MRSSIVARAIVAGVLVAISALQAGAQTTASAECGNGVLDSNEECDPGGGLFCNGDPSQASCTTGAQCVGGVNCYYAFSCCKFNCQFVGQGASCFDGNQCTDGDHCDNVGRCVGQFKADGASCDDEQFCNGADTCQLGECEGHAGDPCTAATDCQTSCNEATDACESTPFVPCADDGNTCTDDVCDGLGSCTHPALPIGTVCRPLGTVCDLPELCAGTGAPCPADVFLPNNTPCGDLCTTNGTCQAGQCAGGIPLMCDDNDVCNGLETCDSLTGCQDGTPLDCTDNDSCTSDPCDPLGGCGPHVGLPDGSICEDGDRCTSFDLCENDVCVGGPTFLGRRRAKVVNDATINRSFAAFDVKGLAAIGKNGFMPDGTAVIGDRVKIGKASDIANIEGNAVITIGADIRGTQGPVTLPLAPEFCEIPPVVCGGADVTVENFEIRTLDPGTYNFARIGEGAIVNFKPGDYSFCLFLAGRGVQVNFLGSTPSVVAIDRLFKLGNESHYGPAAGVPWPTIHAARGLVKFGADGFVTTHVVAPEAKVKILRSTEFDGAVCAKDLKGAWHVTLSCTESAGP